MISTPVRFAATDGVELAGDLFAPDAAIRGAVLIASAMGVRRRLYAAYARSFAAAGLLALTFDYRGIGDSRAGALAKEPARLSDWAERDVAGALRHLRACSGEVPTAYVGHSIGGQLLALVPDARIDAALFVASQSGHFRHWSGWRKAAMAALWHAVVPALVATRGYLPMRALGQGEDVPPGVARQWAEWGRDRRYLRAYLAARDGVESTPLACPLCAYAFTDDPYAPVAGVNALLAAYPRVRADVRVVRPADLGLRAIGHFGVFRESIGAPIWAEQREWVGRALGIAGGGGEENGRERMTRHVA